MNKLPNEKRILIAKRMLYFIIVASKTTDKKLTLNEARIFLEDIYDLLNFIQNN